MDCGWLRGRLAVHRQPVVLSWSRTKGTGGRRRSAVPREPCPHATALGVVRRDRIYRRPDARRRPSNAGSAAQHAPRRDVVDPRHASAVREAGLQPRGHDAPRLRFRHGDRHMAACRVLRFVGVAIGAITMWAASATATARGTPTDQRPDSVGGLPLTLDPITTPWIGDFDGMVARRLIRI